VDILHVLPACLAKPAAYLKRLIQGISAEQTRSGQGESFDDPPQAARFNIGFENIIADNGAHNTLLFRYSCLKQQQILPCCAVGAHRQNGIA
jgi:hypothetical protein